MQRTDARGVVTAIFPSNRWLGGTHDPAGNQTARYGGSFVYDAENRVTSSTVGTVTTTYAYDGEGRRVKKDAVVMVYDAFGKLAAEYGGNSTGAGRQYLTADHLGSTRLVTNSTGGDMKCSDYLPFGEEIPQGVNGRGTCYAAFTDPRQKFTGKGRDAESGLDYFIARYYSGAQGRFTSPDPKMSPSRTDDPQSWNKYGYTRNNPLRYIDPDGEEWQDAKIGPLPDGPVSTRLRDVGIGAAKGIGRSGVSLLRAMGADAHLMDEANRALMPTNARQQMVMNVTEFGMDVDSGKSLAVAGVFLLKRTMALGQAFKSFDALKSALGSAGEGMAWHHIVEQSKVGEFGAGAIHNTANVVNVSREVNTKLNAYYSSKRGFTNGKTVREWLSGKSWEEQYQFGLDRLKEARSGKLK